MVLPTYFGWLQNKKVFNKIIELLSDFPSVDWVLQLDCPEDSTTYLHRVGRTARLAAVGQSLLILVPSEEEGMLKQLRAYKIPIDKIE
jgi:ATP-dependent RNA helicase DDX10/DBP4